MGRNLYKEVLDISGEDAKICIACGRCTAVCPFADIMEFKPHQLVHMVKMNDIRALETDSIWHCASCFACFQRCPRQINVASIIEALRLLNLRIRKDAVELRGLKELKILPTIALVGSGRKYTG
ncbi:MAG: 4Fe-4S dicluster domain-containing protein [Candidatus Njordarchaeota archaeon]